MTNRVNDDFISGDFVEDEKRMWRRGQTPNGGIVRSDSHRGMSQKQVNDALNAPFDALRPLGRRRCDVIQD